MSAGDESETAGTSSLMETTMLEGEECYNPEAATEVWTEKVSVDEQLCRICGNGNEYLIPIFSGEGLEHQLGVKMQKHLPIQVREHDKLPVHVCYQCASTLIAWHDMVTTCVEVQAKLRQMYQQEEEEDDNGADKADFYGDTVDSEMTEDPLIPSISKSATIPPTHSSRKKTVTKAKTKKKITATMPSRDLAETPMELLRPKEEQLEADPTSERYHQAFYFPSTEETQTNLVETNIQSGSSNFPSFKIPRDAQRNAFGIGNVQDEQKKFTCEMCGAKYIRKLYFLQHVNSHALTSHPCLLCGKIFRSVTGLKTHVSQHTVEKTFGNVPILGTNEIQHTDSQYEENLLIENRRNKGYTCDVCHEWFTAKVSIVNHMIDVHQFHKRKYKCWSCDLVFNTSQLLGHHKKKIHLKVKAESSVRIVCTICGEFYSKKYMIHHLSNIHGLGPIRHTCSVCGEGFQSLYKYKCHSVLHTNEKDYVCDICGASFVVMSHLTSHKHSHSSTLAACHLCSATFTHKTSLRRHVGIVHMGKMPKSKIHSCDVCNKSFSSLGRRDEHVALHAEKVLYTCNCGKQFTNRRRLSYHQQREHSQGGFHCAVCGKTFFTKSGIGQHMARSHKDTIHIWSQLKL